MKLIKKYIISRLSEEQINTLLYLISFKYNNKFKNYKKRKKIIHILTPIHGNMGDQAIVFATNKYLKDNFKDYEIVEVYRQDIYKYMKAIKKMLIVMI